MKRVNILTIDTPTIDINVRLAECDDDQKKKLRGAMDRLGMQPAGKIRLTKQSDFSMLSSALQDCPQRVRPGGSMANLFTTLSKLMGRDVQVDMLGVTGQGQHSEMIKNSLKEVGVRLLPEQLPPGTPSPMTAAAINIVDENGSKSAVTYHGNIRDVLTPAVFSRDIIDGNDIMLLQGNNWFRLDQKLPDDIRSACWTHKENWLALPTEPLNDEEVGRFRYLVPSTNVVFGNIGELHRLCREKNEPLLKEADLNPDDKQRALQRLQGAFKEYFPEKEKMKQREGREQVGFITDSKGGAFIVTADDIKHVPVEHRVDKPVNDIGAGDTANAGFAFGYLHKLPYEECARIGNALAAAKLESNDARLADPGQVIREQFPKYASLLGDRRGNGNYR